MASVQEVIASFDLVKIKGRRTACKRMLSVLKNVLDTKLVKAGEEFDHARIARSKVQEDFLKVKKYQQDFEELHFAYLSCRPENADAEEEKRLVEVDDNYYMEVMAIVQGLLEINDKYEASYQIFEDNRHDPGKQKQEEEAKENAAVLAQEEETRN